jgi:UDP-N-acetylmuramate dehydrogenase
VADSFKLQRNVKLAPFTTFKIGGRAKYFVRAEDERALAEALNLAEANELPVFILGGGSNILVSDKGFDGLVLHIALKGIRVNLFGKGRHISVAAGEDWDGFVAYSIENGFAGIECLSGIPGCVGGTPIQNVGAYGQEVSETIVSVRCFDRVSKETVEFRNGDCRFAYRTSIFNSTERDRYIVLEVTFELQHGGKPRIAYRDLINLFDGHNPSLQETRDAVLQIRRAKSMVIDPADVNSQSAGSFFKNPIVSREQFKLLLRRNASLPSFNLDDSSVKLPAAWLIEQSGFLKGTRRGRVGISANHTLALVNFDNATAADILQLKSEIQSAVQSRFGILLKPEPVFVGI